MNKVGSLRLEDREDAIVIEAVADAYVKLFMRALLAFFSSVFMQKVCNELGNCVPVRDQVRRIWVAVRMLMAWANWMEMA